MLGGKVVVGRQRGGQAHPNRHPGRKACIRKSQNTGSEGSGGDGVSNDVEASGWYPLVVGVTGVSGERGGSCLEQCRGAIP